MRIYHRAGHFGLLLAPLLFGLLARGQDTTVLHHAGDTLREVRILGQKPLTERKLDRTIVHVDALLANTGGHAWDVLENTPGVTTEDDGTISLNGKDGVLVLIDDRPTYLSGEQLMNYLKTLPASQLEQIELLPTPPARYPASGGAGIIIIRTRKAKHNGFQVELSSTYAQGVYPKTDHSLDVNGQYGSWQFQSNIGYSYTKNFYSSARFRDYTNPDGSDAGSATQNFAEESWTHTFNYSAGIEHKRRFTSWGLLFSGSTNPYHETDHYNDGFYGPAAQIDSLDQVLNLFARRTSDVATNAHILRTKAHRTLSADADYVHYSNNAVQSNYTTTTVPGDSAENLFDLLSSQPFTADIYSLKTDYTDSLGVHTFFESGLQTSRSVRQNAGTYLDGPPGDVEPADSLDNTFKYTEQINSAYISLRHEGTRLSLQAGLRLENTYGHGQSSGNLDSSFTLNYTNLFPSFHALWSLDSNKRQQLGFTYARRIDRPDYYDLNPSRFYFDPNTYFSGNPTVQPEFSNNLELSYTLLDRYTLTGSYSLTHGLINPVYISQGTDFYYYTINMHEQVTYGLSADVSTPLTAAWSLNTHVEWMYKHYQASLPDSQYLNETRPNIVLSGNTRYSFKGGWSAEISGFYKSDELRAQAIIRPTGRLNAALRKKIWKSKATLTLAGNDLLRTGSFIRDIYVPGAFVYARNWYDRRQVLLTFTYAFGNRINGIKEHTSGAASERARL